MFILYTTLAVVISTLIESVRINTSYGKTENINKVATFTIGAILFGVCLALIYTDYYYTPSVIEVGIYGLFYASVRGVIYDPLLNVLTKKPLTYISTKTNSIIDWVERTGLKWGFWTERIIYITLSIISAFLFKTIYNHS
jgi:hypothetical protein